jgi:hypothetical protein
MDAASYDQGFHACSQGQAVKSDQPSFGHWVGKAGDTGNRHALLESKAWA